MRLFDSLLVPICLFWLLSVVGADQICPGVPDGGFCPFDPAHLDAVVCCDLGFGPHCCNRTEFEEINTTKFYILWGAVGVGLVIGCLLVPICVVVMHFSIQKLQKHWGRSSKNKRAHRSSVMPPRRPEPLEEQLYGPGDDEPVDSSAYSQAIASKTSPFYRKYSELTQKGQTLETDLPSATTANDTTYANQFYDIQLQAEDSDLLDKQRMLWRKSSFQEGERHSDNPAMPH